MGSRPTKSRPTSCFQTPRLSLCHGGDTRLLLLLFPRRRGREESGGAGHRPPEGSSPLSPPSAPPGCSVALLAPTRFSLIRVRSWIVAVRVREWWCWVVKSAAAMLSRISQLGARLLRENRAGTHPFRVSCFLLVNPLEAAEKYFQTMTNLYIITND